MIADTDIMDAQIKGLDERLRTLRGELALFQKAKGMDETAETQRVNAESAAKAGREAKEALEELRKKKDRAVAGSCAKLAETMSAILPDGKAVLRIEEDGGVTLAWEREGRVTPHAGLSGGEKVLFEAALAHALLGQAPHRLLILEAAELDQARLAGALGHIAATNPGAALIVNTCHVPAVVPEGWDVVEMGVDHGNA